MKKYRQNILRIFLGVVLDISIPVNTINNFQYWGLGGNCTNQNGWETVCGFSIRENGTHGSFSYTF